jgi:hypothetical protein
MSLTDVYELFFQSWNYTVVGTTLDDETFVFPRESCNAFEFLPFNRYIPSMTGSYWFYSSLLYWIAS